jgi:mono/diheme cytochrome c family protein
LAVQQQRVRGLIAAVALTACGQVTPEQPTLQGYLRDAAARRAALEASLLRRDNHYAQRRLRFYESGEVGDWSRLPVWNPPTATAALDGAPVAWPRPLEVPPEAVAGDPEALRALGERAFWGYPAQLAPDAVDRGVRAGEGLTAHGLLTEGGVRVGVLRVRLPDGELGVALSCAACHVARRAGALVPGVANDALDLGALAARDLPAGALADRLRAWGAGRVDITTDDGAEPAAIPDLRALRWQSHLHRAGAVILRDEASLAVRIETLLITSLHAAVRPPREVSAGLALYLLSLGEALPAPRWDHPGAAVFRANCAQCHAGEGMRGGVIPAEDIGTDDTLARSPDRGTGGYRIPSLRGVGARTWLLHDGSARGLDALLDPARETPGHDPGRSLRSADRAALLSFLRDL